MSARIKLVSPRSERPLNGPLRDGVDEHDTLRAQSLKGDDQLRHALDGYNILPDRSLSILELKRLLSRAEMDLFAYPHCTQAELANFCRQRHEDIPQAHQLPLNWQYTELAKRDLIKILDAADAEFVFYRFLDLPAELRNNIYELVTIHKEYKESSPIRPLEHKRQHIPSLAITRVSKQLRQETLPMFYMQNTFAFNTVTRAYGLAASNQLKIWLRKIDTEAASSIRHISLGAGSRNNMPSWFSCDMNVTVDLTEQELEVAYLRNGCSCPACPLSKENLSKFKDFVDKKVSRKERTSTAFSGKRIYDIFVASKVFIF